MKKLLASDEGLDKIFNISYCFRDEPYSPIHRNQFLMLEWYRKGERYEQIMKDVKRLIQYTQDNITAPIPNKITSFQQVTVQELFQEYLNFDVLNFLDKTELKNKIQKDHKDVPLPSAECSWDDYFFLLFLNKVEPHFKTHPYLLVKEFPAPLAALSTINDRDHRVCDRFEVYLNGIELCNCFNEITNYTELKKRFEDQANEKKELYHYELAWPKEFMQTMEKYPSSSGIALGVERLLLALTNISNPFFK